MIHRVSDSVDIAYGFHGIKDGKPAVPAHYCLCINTGRESLEMRETPVPDIGQITNFLEAYRYEATELLVHSRHTADRCIALSQAIGRELLHYFPIPEFLTYRYKGRYYAVLDKSLWSCTRSLTEDEWRALITRALAREEARLTTYVTGRSPEISKREFIPESVRVAVWRRDEARCVRCGSNERLEFDHIIPVALGGSSTARNIQLLCQRCNRAKSASIV